MDTFFNLGTIQAQDLTSNLLFHSRRLTGTLFGQRGYIPIASGETCIGVFFSSHTYLQLHPDTPHRTPTLHELPWDGKNSPSPEEQFHLMQEMITDFLASPRDFNRSYFIRHPDKPTECAGFLRFFWKPFPLEDIENKSFHLLILSQDAHFIASLGLDARNIATTAQSA